MLTVAAVALLIAAVATYAAITPSQAETWLRRRGRDRRLP